VDQEFIISSSLFQFRFYGEGFSYQHFPITIPSLRTGIQKRFQELRRFGYKIKNGFNQSTLRRVNDLVVHSLGNPFTFKNLINPKRKVHSLQFKDVVRLLLLKFTNMCLPSDYIKKYMWSGLRHKMAIKLASRAKIDDLNAFKLHSAPHLILTDGVE